MAAVSLSPAPHKLGGMSNRRIPLGENPNAANSPFQSVAAVISKRSREQAEVQEDFSCSLQPRAKRQALENGRALQRGSPKRQPLHSTEGRVFNRRPTDAQPTAFEKKLFAAREGKSQQRLDKQERASQMQMDDIRQWQRHYKKLFPSFVFYFESLPEDVRAQSSKYIKTLGAREEKFFSKEVTHVVTTRPIPAENDAKDALSIVNPSSALTSSQPANQPRTVNPSCLERHSDYHGQPFQSRNKFTFEATASKRSGLSNSRDAEPRKSAGTADILSRAKEMGMKVWSLDKLQRAIHTMFETPNDPQLQAGTTNRVRGVVAPVKGDREPDLSRMLRNERLNGPSDRDATATINELIPFKGYHIYVRDIDERTKPILVRDYPKPAHDDDREWPQFHSVGLGKCPFVPEADAPTREEIGKAKAREDELRARARVEARAPQTRAATSRGQLEAESAKSKSQQRPLEVNRNGGNAVVQKHPSMPTTGLCPPPPVSVRTKSPAKAAKELMANTGTKLFGGEPAASGMQPSNITSAIRSQMISSTAAAPGCKAGTSKEVHGLKRKVLEKNSGPALTNVHSRQCSIDSVGPGRAERTIPATRQTRKQAPEPLIHIDEETTQSEEDEDVWLAEEARNKRKKLQREIEKKNVKPGYCENCREKYDDFDDHIVGRKHRKFALTQENWKDLDRLLAHLGRQLKEPDSDSF